MKLERKSNVKRLFPICFLALILSTMMLVLPGAYGTVTLVNENYSCDEENPVNNLVDITPSIQDLQNFVVWASFNTLTFGESSSLLITVSHYTEGFPYLNFEVGRDGEGIYYMNTEIDFNENDIFSTYALTANIPNNGAVKSVYNSGAHIKNVLNNQVLSTQSITGYHIGATDLAYMRVVTTGEVTGAFNVIITTDNLPQYTTPPEPVELFDWTIYAMWIIVSIIVAGFLVLFAIVARAKLRDK